MVNEYFLLTETFNGFKVGTILLKGDQDVKESTDGTQEYFDISTEIKTGKSYSCYDPASNILVKLECEKHEVVDKAFKLYFDEGSNPDFEILQDIIIAETINT